MTDFGLGDDMVNEDKREAALDWHNMSCLPLFQRHSITRRAAAESLPPTTVNACQRQVLKWLADQPDGATDEQMQLGIPMPPSTQRPRRIELVAKGMIVQAGEGKTASGRRAVKWQITAASR